MSTPTSRQAEAATNRLAAFEGHRLLALRTLVDGNGPEYQAINQVVQEDAPLTLAALRGVLALAEDWKRGNEQDRTTMPEQQYLAVRVLTDLTIGTITAALA